MMPSTSTSSPQYLRRTAWASSSASSSASSGSSRTCRTCISESPSPHLGEGLSEMQVLQVLELPDEALDEALELAHAVRLKYCGEDVEVEGIISVKTGGCPEDCHFCSQSGLFDSPVRSVWLDIPELVKAAKETAATGATEFCIVAAVRGPDARLMKQVKFAIDRINEAVDINIACSLQRPAGSDPPRQREAGGGSDWRNRRRSLRRGQ